MLRGNRRVLLLWRLSMIFDSKVESIIGVVWPAGFAAVGTIVLRLGLHQSWREVMLAVCSFIGLLIAMIASSALIRKRGWSQLGRALVVTFCCAEIALIAYSGSRWGLLPTFGRGELWLFIGIAGVFVLAFLFAPQSWLEHAGEMKCRRCGHYHEGRDCTCGCQADQFKYPAFQGP
jgi:hypothetical protein